MYAPEIPVNIVELGLVCDLAIDQLPEGASRVAAKMTFITPSGGTGDIIADDAKRRIPSLSGVADADVQVALDHPWNQSLMNEAGKLELGML